MHILFLLNLSFDEMKGYQYISRSNIVLIKNTIIDINLLLQVRGLIELICSKDFSLDKKVKELFCLVQPVKYHQ